MRPDVERGEPFLHHGQQLPDRLLVRQPGEVQRQPFASVERAEPQVVPRDRADLGREQDGCQPGPEFAQRLHRRDGVPDGHEVLGLEFVPDAGREVQAEMRDPFVPRSGDAELSRAIVRRDTRRVGRMPWPVRRRRAEEVPASSPRSFDPDLVHLVAGPVGEQADAVPGVLDLVEVLVHRFPGQAVEDVLAEVERRHQVEGQPGHHTQRAETDDHAAVPGERLQLAVGGHQLHTGHRRRQALVTPSGAVGRRRDGARHRAVRQRREVGQGEPGGVQLDRDVTVAGRRGHRDRRRTRVEDDVPVERGEIEQDATRAVRDVVETVPAADRLDRARAGDGLLNLSDRAWPEDPLRGEGLISRPVRLSHQAQPRLPESASPGGGAH